MFKNALVSVSNKEGLVDFLKPLVAKGLRIVSTGGTAKLLRENGIKVVEAAEQTGFPEVMDGRVRTLHPNIHMALLARSYDPADLDLLEQRGIEPFDLVIGNLYPFGAALKENLSEQDLVEYIDIGGPALLRAAAKSFERIAVICDPRDYSIITEKAELTLNDRRRLAAKVFSHVSAYDAMVARHFSGEELFDDFSLGGNFVAEMRYGENSHQKAAWYNNPSEKGGLHEARIIQGKALSFNNILDLEAATSTVREFKTTAAVGVKHNNPCGAATGWSALEAVRRVLSADPISIFGGIVACNQTLTGDAAQELSKIFLECVVAPEFTPEALQIFASKKNLRVLEWPGLMEKPQGWDVRTVTGGFLVQTLDRIEPWSSEWQVIGEKPGDAVKADLMFAWKICAHLKSNAIALVKDGQTVGLGMGQVNRVEAVQHSLTRMRQHHKDIAGVVMASDAFFPFPDSIEIAAQGGVKWIIQPGGSMKDEEVIAKAKECGINMILTGRRHFRH